MLLMVELVFSFPLYWSCIKASLVGVVFCLVGADAYDECLLRLSQQIRGSKAGIRVPKRSEKKVVVRVDWWWIM